MSAQAGYPTPLQPNSAASEYNKIEFIVSQLINRMATATLVKVMAVTNDGGVNPIGTVDVQPMVKQVDGALNGFSHGTIYKLPYLRVQGGANAVILDPQVGDIGLAVFCHTDSSVVRSTKAEALPGSRRRFDWADGVYCFGCLGQVTPTQYVSFSADGISIQTPNTLTGQADVEIDLDSPLVNTSENLSAGNGATGVVGTGTGQTLTFNDGILTDIS